MGSVADREINLIDGIISRDEEALSALYQLYGAQVHGISLYILRNEALAEEATQDTFLKIWDNAHQWEPRRSSLTTWIYTIARFTAIDMVRREHRHFGSSEIDDDLHLYTDSLGTMGSDWDNAQLLKSLISQLPEEQIQAIELAFFMGMSHQEIAFHLQQPLGTIKSRIRNGLHVLRSMWLMTTR